MPPALTFVVSSEGPSLARATRKWAGYRGCAELMARVVTAPRSTLQGAAVARIPTASQPGVEVALSGFGLTLRLRDGNERDRLVEQRHDRLQDCPAEHEER